MSTAELQHCPWIYIGWLKTWKQYMLQDLRYMLNYPSQDCNAAAAPLARGPTAWSLAAPARHVGAPARARQQAAWRLAAGWRRRRHGLVHEGVLWTGTTQAPWWLGVGVWTWCRHGQRCTAVSQLFQKRISNLQSAPRSIWMSSSLPRTLVLETFRRMHSWNHEFIRISSPTINAQTEHLLRATIMCFKNSP